MRIILYTPSNINSIVGNKLKIKSLNYLYKIIAPFILTRVKSYIKNNIKVDILMINNNFTFKKIKIKTNLNILFFKNYFYLKKFFYLNAYLYDYFFIHFINFKVILILFLNLNLKKIIFVHGIELQKTSEYFFEFPSNVFFY